ncbi:beta strand repeat-containing protein [Marichromatium bheemlicum]|uniref:S-layer protein n=1 Tax=Marichromatium bheemlicum TaxID=365339 RepID=A0ABX1I5Y8_9GAMM|nr:hypothetical protein [Marichromatium bheemlicum]NKN32897.1 hypothetical protein [Marichromatium bheemlicum]
MALQGFDQAFYLGAKLQQLQANKATAEQWADKTADDLLSTLKAAGMTPEQHYSQYGYAEGLGPNKFFNPNEYALFKGKQLVANNPDLYKDADAAAKAFVEKWPGNLYDHYLQYGAQEGINPSNAFDNDAYFEAKLAALQAAGQKITLDELKDAFADAGLTPVSHFMLYGAKEKLQAPVVPAEEQVDPNVTPGTDFALTGDVDILLPVGAALPEGKTEEDVQRTTNADDNIDAVSSALSSARTLNADDNIDGGEGNDLLKVDMQSNFAGFSKDGGVKNIDTIELVNKGAIDRSFDATGVEGDVHYAVTAEDGTVNLKDLGSLAGGISLSGQSDGTFKAAFVADAVKGTEDTLALGLKDVGTVQTDTVKEAAVAVDVKGVEKAALSVEGDNVVNLSNVSATEYTVAGTGNLQVNALASKLSSFDATNLQGDVDLTVDANSALKNATLQGGSGDDTLTLSGAGTVQYAVGGFETLALANTGKLTFSAAESNGIQNVQATGDMGAEASFAGLGNADMTLGIEGGADAVTLDNSGSTTVNVADEAATADKPPVPVDAGVTLTNSAALTLNVAEHVVYDGTINAAKAESVNIAAAGGFGSATDQAGIIQAGSATELTIGKIGADSTLILQAGKAQQLTLNADADLDLDQFTNASGNAVSSDLSGLQALNATVNGGKLTMGALKAINAITLEGNGEAKLGDLGSGSQADYGITVTAGALSDTDGSGSALEIGTITTKGTDISVDAAKVLGDVDLGAINANGGDVTLSFAGTNGDVTLNGVTGETVEINADGALGKLTTGDVVATTANITGAGLDVNDITVTASKAATVVGGIADDKITVKAVADAKADATLTGGVGADTFTIKAVSGGDDGTLVATITDFELSTDKVAGVTAANLEAIASWEAADAATFLSAAFGGTVAADDITLVNLANTGTAQNAIVYNGDTYLVAEDGTTGFGGTDVIVKLAGVEASTATEVFGA